MKVHVSGAPVLLLGIRETRNEDARRAQSRIEPILSLRQEAGLLVDVEGD